jgi:hydroxypyruvate isomerase
MDDLLDRHPEDRSRNMLMSSMLPATVWWCLEPQCSPSEIVELSLRAGYAGVELAPQEEWSRIAAAGLTIVSHRGHDTLEDGLNRIKNHDRIEHEILNNLEMAQKWHIPVLICFSGNRDGLDDEAGAEATAMGLSRVAAAAEEAGVVLVLELLNSRVDHPHYQCDRTDWGIDVVNRVGSPSVKLLYDVYHMQIMEGDLIRTIERHHQSFGHYHIAGNPGRNEPDGSQEIHYPAVLRAIANTDYRGFVGMEYLPLSEPAESLASTRGLLQSVSL